MSDSTLDTCGCCQGPDASTPATLENAPGKDALAYRTGVHASFKAAMLTTLAGEPAARALATRDDTDPAIALLDSWAAVLDVLTFYQERIANEGFLRTSTERRSLLELARAIGYELRPGVAASSWLAFTMDNVVGSPQSVQLAIGTKAQSVPGQDENPQTFETVEAIEARPAWNVLKPRLFESSTPYKLGDSTIYLDGTATSLNPGDALLIIGDERKATVGSERWDIRRVKTIDTVPLPPTSGANAGYTVVTLDHGLGTTSPHVIQPATRNPRVYALRQRAALFGYNALDWKALPDTTKKAYLGLADTATLTADQKAEWKDFNTFASTNPYSIHLDAAYPKIISGKGWLVLSTPAYSEVCEIVSAVESARAEFGLSGKTTLIELKGENFDRFTTAVRTAVVLAQSEELTIAERPVTSAIEGGEIEIVPAVDGLAEGRLLAISGVDDATGEDIAEIAEIKSVTALAESTLVTLTAHLTHTYRRDSVTINANVASATHGETKTDEILGSGDGSVPFQSFTLKQKPVTYVSAAVPAGAESTLEIRVKGVLWSETPSFYGTPSTDRAFAVRRADNGAATVRFGDGTTGARLPTGTNNVRATYRIGIGLDGNVDAGQITQLLSRPLGLKAVVNPVEASGGDDPEDRDDARTNAPLTVLTLDRIVSLRDFEDFARAFAGIGKAQATLLWSGERQLVHLTVAAADGTAIDPASDLFTNLVDAIDAARHADQPVVVSPHEELKFSLVARIATDAALVRDDVLEAVADALTAAFSFECRGFGQAVTVAEILAVMQNVEGVVAVDLEALGGLDPIKNPALPARIARYDGASIRGAELLVIDPDDITFSDLPL